MKSLRNRIMEAIAKKQQIETYQVKEERIQRAFALLDISATSDADIDNAILESNKFLCSEKPVNNYIEKRIEVLVDLRSQQIRNRDLAAGVDEWSYHYHDEATAQTSARIEELTLMKDNLERSEQ